MKQLISVHLVIRNVKLYNSGHVCELGVLVHVHNAVEMEQSMVVKQLFRARLVT